MLCQQCGQNPASVTVQTIQGNEKQTQYLCADCFAALTNTNLAQDFFSPFQMLSGFFPQKYAEAGRDLRCERCGTTYAKFRETGRFGCADCYDAFADRLKPLFKKIQYSDNYEGKKPGSPAQNALARLEKQLKQAVAREDYERAAQLKQEIERQRREAQS